MKEVELPVDTKPRRIVNHSMCRTFPFGQGVEPVYECEACDFWAVPLLDAVRHAIDHQFLVMRRT